MLTAPRDDRRRRHYVEVSGAFGSRHAFGGYRSLAEAAIVAGHFRDAGYSALARTVGRNKAPQTPCRSV